MQGLNQLHIKKQANGSLVPFKEKKIVYLQAYYLQDGKWRKVKTVKGNV